MIGLQESFQRFVGWRVEYGIGDSVMVEMQDENLRWQPKEDHLVRWGLWGRTEPNPKFDGHKTSFIRAEWPGAEEEEEEWLRNGGQHLPEGMVMCCTAM